MELWLINEFILSTSFHLKYIKYSIYSNTNVMELALHREMPLLERQDHFMKAGTFRSRTSYEGLINSTE